MSRNAKRLSGLHRFLFRIKKKLISLNYDNLMKPYKSEEFSIMDWHCTVFEKKNLERRLWPFFWQKD